MSRALFLRRQPYYLFRIEFTSNWNGIFPPHNCQCFNCTVLCARILCKELDEIVRKIVGPFLQSCTE